MIYDSLLNKCVECDKETVDQLLMHIMDDGLLRKRYDIKRQMIRYDYVSLQEEGIIDSKKAFFWHTRSKYNLKIVRIYEILRGLP